MSQQSQQPVELVPHPSAKVIRRSEDYVVDGFGKVTVLEAIDLEKAAAAKEPRFLFQGFAILGAMVAGQIRQFPVEWLIEGVNNVEEAFDVFQVQAVEQLKKNMAEAQARAAEERNRIIAAPAGTVPNKLII